MLVKRWFFALLTLADTMWAIHESSAKENGERRAGKSGCERERVKVMTRGGQPVEDGAGGREDYERSALAGKGVRQGQMLGKGAEIGGYECRMVATF